MTSAAAMAASTANSVGDGVGACLPKALMPPRRYRGAALGRARHSSSAHRLGNGMRVLYAPRSALATAGRSTFFLQWGSAQQTLPAIDPYRRSRDMARCV